MSKFEIRNDGVVRSQEEYFALDKKCAFYEIGLSLNIIV